jgi:hypothetical protein
MPPVPKPRKRRKQSPRQIIRNALTRQRASLRRKARPKVRKVSKRFAQRRNAAYADFIRSLPCHLWGRPQLEAFSGRIHLHRCKTPVVLMHVKSRGAGADDLGATVPCCQEEHDKSHTRGIKTWATAWHGSLDELQRIARDVYPAQYEKAKTFGWEAL